MLRAVAGKRLLTNPATAPRSLHVPQECFAYIPYTIATLFPAAFFEIPPTFFHLVFSMHSK